MRKLIAVGVLVGGLLAGAGWGQAEAQTFLPNQGGIGDPLTLAASGVLIPYITGGASGTLALVEIASPVGKNNAPNLHLIFYTNTCVRAESVSLPETTNDIAFVNPSFSVVSPTSGLVAIAGNLGSFDMTKLESPIHTRVYEFNPADGRSRVFEPIIIDTAEFGVAAGENEHIWSPLRTAATFYAPLETATVKTQLTLICPRSTIQGAADAAFGQVLATSVNFSTLGFPIINPLFNSGVTSMRGVVYDTNEVYLADVNFTCDCLSPDVAMTTISPAGAYSSLGALFGTYTEIEVVPGPGSFTGYKASFTVGNGLNNFNGRLSNGSRPSIEGTLTNTR